MKNRYQDKPLLRLLECYILDAIGELSDIHKHNLDAITPKLQKTYNKPGDWKEIIEQVMNITTEKKEAINKIWLKNQLIAEQSDEILDSENFAQMFVDRNFDIT